MRVPWAGSHRAFAHVAHLTINGHTAMVDEKTIAISRTSSDEQVGGRFIRCRPAMGTQGGFTWRDMAHCYSCASGIALVKRSQS